MKFSFGVSPLIFLLVLSIFLLVLLIEGASNIAEFINDCLTARLHAKLIDIPNDFNHDRRYKVLIRNHWWNNWKVYKTDLYFSEADDLVKKLKDRGHE